MSTYSRLRVKDHFNQLKSTLQTKIANYHRPQLSKILKSQVTHVTISYLTQATRFVGQVYHSLRLTIGRFEKRLLSPYAGLLIIAVFVLVGNEANHQAQASQGERTTTLTDIAPEQVDQVLTALDPLTPELNEDPDTVASLLIADDEAYLTRPDFSSMTEAEKSSKKDPIPYTVAQGDTLVTIAKKNGRSVATILEANNIKPEAASAIVPGTVLLIPQEDTSDSLAWLDVENKARADAAQKLQEKRAQLLAQRQHLQASLAQATRGNRALAAGLDDERQRTTDTYGGDPAGGLIVPIHHNGISRGLGGGHTGIDYRANVGTPVAAAADGKVIEITHGWAGGWGNSILVDHGDGRTSRYAHLSDVQVGIGENVSQGEQIGLSGNTGHSTGPHLHFEVRINNRPVWPF